MDSQRMFSELQTGARFKFDHDADSGHVWTKTGRRDYSRIETKRIGSSSAPVTPIPPTPGDEGAAIVMLRNAGLALEDLEFLGEDVYAAFDAATLTVALSTQAGARIVLTPDVLDRLGRFAQRAIYERQRQPLDARAHAGDGDGAAREAGALDALDVATIDKIVGGR